MSGACQFYRRIHTGPRNRAAFEQGQENKRQIRELMLAHVQRNPFAKPLTAKQIHQQLPWIQPSTVSHYMQIIRDEAEAELFEKEQVAVNE